MHRFRARREVSKKLKTLCFNIAVRACSACAFLVAFFLVAAPRPMAANTLEEGVMELARQIVDKSLATERTTLAVAAFPHADDTCSKMSNYLVDELVLSLFTVQSGELEIIERSQLGRIFAELQLSMTGAVDANTTQELGRLYGVDSLLIGSLTLVGETLRVNSRLIDTETGRVFSAAAVSIPKTPTIDALMSERAAGGCTLAPETRGSGGNTTNEESSVGTSGTSAGSALPAFSGAVDLENMVGNWRGTVQCGDATELGLLELEAALPNGLPGRMRVGSTSVGAFLALSSELQDGQAVFELSAPRWGTATLRMVSTGVLKGDFKETDRCSSVYLGQEK